MAAARTKADMPARKSKYAPKTFKGQPLYTKEFLSEYEDLLTQNNVTTDKDKCELIRRYCSSQVRDILETVYNAADPNWESFKSQIEKLFDSDRREQRYR